jgi:Dolichyl-phosphate-mannose-protein mannosyltransferase
VTAPADLRRYSVVLPLLLLFFVVLLALHLPLLDLPYFWDEAGYYIPAARDLLLTGSLIPRSSISNAHPPLVTAYLALAWKLFGSTPAVTRTAMLGVAAFTLLGLFRLAERVASPAVAIASVISTALYPVFFTQSSFAQLDLAAAGFTFWGILAYVEGRRWTTALWFSLGVLSKETAILAPLALLACRLGLERIRTQENPRPSPPSTDRGPEDAANAGCFPQLKLSRGDRWPLWVASVPLTLWYVYHWHQTGFVFGNPEFLRYNLKATLQPTRILLALGIRLWQVLGYMNLFVLTLATLFAWQLPPQSEPGRERPRIALDVQFSFLAVIVAYVLALSVIGGAVLARYLLPALPLIMILSMSTLRRRVRHWQALVAIVALGLLVALFLNPPYGFSLEDNLAYRDYVLLHRRAASWLEVRYPRARVLTAWPASDELRRPYLGYVSRPLDVLRIEDFTVEQLVAANELPAHFDVALVFSTKYESPCPWLERWRIWREWETRFFGYHRDVRPSVAAQILGGQLVYQEQKKGQWVGIIAAERIEQARALSRRAATPPSDDRSASSRPAKLLLRFEALRRPGLPASAELPSPPRN